MQILIIGGFGYIGSQVLDSICESPDFRDAHVVVVDNWTYGRGAPPLLAYFREKLPRFRACCIDFSDTSSDTLRELVGGSDYIINAASLTQIPNSDLHVKYILHGVENLQNMILESGGKLIKVIDLSSTSVYGPVKTRMPKVAEPYGEEVHPDPEIAFHNYASSKLRAERLWLSERCKNIPFTEFRLSTVFGYSPGMRYNQFIGQFLVDAVAGRETLLPGAPTNFRPFVHVRDVARLMLHLFGHDFETNGHIINVGAAELNPMLEELFASLSAMLRRRFGVEAAYKFACELGPPPFEEDYRVDFSKFESMVDFKLEYGFEDGARELVEKVLGLS